jgi:XTP/dITP diphosphohydrolase
MDAISINSFVFASSNAGKCLEVKRYAAPLGIEVVGIPDIASGIEAPVPQVKEVGASYERNAVLKARAYAQWSGRACVADDTGVEIDALRGLPGLHTARWGIGRVAGELGVDFKGGAAFVCCMAYAEPSGRIVSVTSRMGGTLILNPSVEAAAVKPLQFSQFFTPDGYTENLEDLWRRGIFVSHRIRSLQALLTSLR